MSVPSTNSLTRTLTGASLRRDLQNRDEMRNHVMWEWLMVVQKKGRLKGDVMSVFEYLMDCHKQEGTEFSVAPEDSTSVKATGK